MPPLTTRRRQAGRRRDPALLALDIGHEPAIALGDAPTDGHEHFRSLLRWIAGAAIGGLAATALMAAAIYLGLGAQSNFASAPDYAPEQVSAGDVAGGASLEKGDRLVRPVDVIAAKQTFKADTPVKVGDGEVVKTRIFTYLSTNLSTAPSNFASAVPPFNPNHLTDGTGDHPEALPDIAPAAENAEISFVARDAQPADLTTVAGELSADDVAAQIGAMIKSPAKGSDPGLGALDMLKMVRDTPNAAYGALPYATTGGIDRSGPFGALQVRITPENVVNVGRNVAASAPADRLVSVKHGETLEEVLRENGAPPARIAAIQAAFKDARGLGLNDGQKVLLHFEDPDEGSNVPAIVRVGLVADEKEVAAAAIDDSGAFKIVKSAPPAVGSAKKPAGEGEQNSGGISLYQSVYESGLKQGLAKPIIDELISSFASDVDYQRGVSPGDSLIAFYSNPDDIDPKPQLLYAALTVKDQTFRYYRFRTPDDGLVDFYDETGKSSRKFLLRKPIAAGEITSTFGMRFHPILHYARMHNGVDWGAPYGTPILAAGNGTVLKAEFSSGYGRRVEIQHANGYVTTYNHMSAFAKGMEPGARVTQGQVVGYLGQSGLATGPHLHYEVIINGNIVDPLGIKLARTREFDGKMLGLFKKEKARIDGLIAQAPNAAIATTASNASAAKLN